MPTQVEKVIAFAKSKIGSGEYPNLCQKFVRLCFEAGGISGGGGAASAKEAFGKWKQGTDKNIPVGAAVYFKGSPVGGVYYGHVGIYVGNGYVIHAANKVVQQKLSEIPNYLGWGYQCGKEPGGAYIEGEQAAEGAAEITNGAVNNVSSSTSSEPLNQKIKTAEITAVIIQKNINGTGKDNVLVCGTFQVDTIEGAGPPATVTLKATSIPYTSAIRSQLKNKGWEKIKLSAIAKEIAGSNSLNCMYESDYDPLYDRKEQIQESDLAFLQRLCTDAGISLKVTSKTIVLFDEVKYEQKPTIRALKKGEADILSYSFSTGLNDTAYSSCHVSYTDPATGETIEHTYTPRDITAAAQVLEINEKVKDKEEARQLAMKRLRQKNKGEYKAEFSLMGDVEMVAGVTVDLVGWGAFDGKYIIEKASHSVSGGYVTQISLRKVLEGY